MSGPGFATRQDLLRWADTTGSRAALPRLIRRLVLETGNAVEAVDFPADEGTAAGGWDGVARTASTSTFVPAGLSAWELSVQSSYAKADTDYAKRKTSPDGAPTSETTYCQVILRPWTKRQEFAKAKGKQGRWREVRAYGVDDVLAWLECAPATHTWISELLGLKPFGMQTAATWWAGWSTATAPELSPALVLAGRDTAAARLATRLAESNPITTLHAESHEEALAFIAATVLAKDASGDGDLLARTVFVDNVETWRSLAGRGKRLILVAMTTEVIDQARSAANHYVIVPISAPTGADVDVPPIESDQASSELKALSVDSERAEHLGTLARRSLIALRRRLARKPELHRPAWAQPPTDRFLRGVLLVGRAASDSDGDLALLGGLAGVDANEARERLDALTRAEDSLIDSGGGVWSLVSADDAWSLLQPSLRRDDLERFKTAVMDVLLEPDPLANFTETERLVAQFEGKRRQYSDSLRRGLCGSLALLGTHGRALELSSGSTGDSWAGYVVRDLLETANGAGGADVWASLAPYLSLLAEAAPDVFLQAVRAGTTGPDPLLADIFRDKHDGSGLFGPTSPHNALLWALEVIAWDPQHFGAAVESLARLDEVDPGGRMGNRPLASLIEIYCPWRPETGASAESRLNALDGMRTRHEATAWRLMLQLLPKFHGIHHPTASPRFRDWRPSRREVLVPEYEDFVNGVAIRLQADAGTKAVRWSELIEAATHLSPEQRTVIQGALQSLAESGTFQGDDGKTLWDYLRGFVAKHREFRDAKWALPPSELEILASVTAHLEPTGARESGAWLFSEHRPDLDSDERRREDLSAYEQEVARLRAEVAGRVYQEDGLSGILTLTSSSVVPAEVGIGLATATGDQHADSIIPLLASSEPAEVAMSSGFAWKRFRDAGWPAIEALLKDGEIVSPVVIARLLIATQDSRAAWQCAERLGSTVLQTFWEQWPGYGGVQSDPEAVIEGARGLVSVGRCAAALDLLGLALHSRKDDPQFAEAIVESLDAMLALDEADPEIGRLQSYTFESLFDYLERHRESIGTTEVGRLEWAYLAALGFEPVVPSLHAALADDPSFFVDLMKAIYRKRSDETSGETAPQNQAVAENGYRLLSTWRTVPGVHDGVLDPDALAGWISTALAQLGEEDRLEVGEMQVGQMLASAPPDDDGVQPARTVRDLLEDLQSDRVDRSLASEIYNRRGITSRGLQDGGDQERVLADRYGAWAAQFADRWPRAASLLRGLEDDYRADALSQDISAEKRKRGLDR